jgi:hypothetical protein
MLTIPKSLLGHVETAVLDAMIRDAANVGPLDEDYLNVQEFLRWAIPVKDAMQRLDQEIADNPSASIHDTTHIEQVIELMASQARFRLLSRILPVLK